MSLHFIFFIIMKLYVYNYSTYVKTKSMFNYYYNMMREEADVDREINWLSKIPQEKWAFAWDSGRRWRHMTTNHVESINYVLKKIVNRCTSKIYICKV